MPLCTRWKFLKASCSQASPEALLGSARGFLRQQSDAAREPRSGTRVTRQQISLHPASATTELDQLQKIALCSNCPPLGGPQGRTGAIRECCIGALRIGEDAGRRRGVKRAGISRSPRGSGHGKAPQGPTGRPSDTAACELVSALEAACCDSNTEGPSAACRTGSCART